MTQSSGSIHRSTQARSAPPYSGALLNMQTPQHGIGRNFHWVAGAAVVADDHVWERRPQVSTLWVLEAFGRLWGTRGRTRWLVYE